MNTLICYSSGDRRFSALYARLRSNRTIEQCYQGAKRDERQNAFLNPKGKQPIYLFLNKQLYPCIPELRHQFYRMLWEVYFQENPQLLDYACCHQSFSEGGKSTVFRLPMDTGEGIANLFSISGGCNQAQVIAQLVLQKEYPFHPLVPAEWWLYNPEVMQAMSKYREIYPIK